VNPVDFACTALIVGLSAVMEYPEGTLVATGAGGLGVTEPYATAKLDVPSVDESTKIEVDASVADLETMLI
jgi:hypothetical protein